MRFSIRKFQFLILLVHFFGFVRAQNVPDIHICHGVKYDTITGSFVREVNAAGLFYVSGHAILQANSVFPDLRFNSVTIGNVYINDTIVHIFWSNGVDYFKDRDNCLNLRSLSELEHRTHMGFLKGKEKRLFKRSLIKDSIGVQFVKFKAKLVVINAGRQKWMIPKGYCSELFEQDNQENCYRYFQTTLLVADVLDFEYSHKK